MQASELGTRSLLQKTFGKQVSFEPEVKSEEVVDEGSNENEDD